MPYGMRLKKNCYKIKLLKGCDNLDFPTMCMILTFATAIYSMIVITIYQNKIDTLTAINDIYKSHWEELCNQMLAEIEEDGYCRLVATREQIEEMMEILDIGDDKHKKAKMPQM